MKKTIHFSMLLVAIVASVFVSCSDNDSAKGKVQLYITDAPVDDENVSAVYLTINGVEMRGEGGWETVAEFESPVKINILDYQEGNAYFLTEEFLNAGTYSEARLMLDAPAENGAPLSNPGCYIEYADGATQPLYIPSGAQSGYKVKGAFTLAAGGVVAVTLDFDVRKSIVEAGASEKFLLKPVVRLVANQEAALIEGTYSGIAAGSRLVVYAYEKDTYVATEADANAEGMRFTNAITSDLLNENGEFTLAFMNSGEYDLVFVNIDEEGNPIEVLGTLETSVSAGQRLTLAVSIESLVTL